MSYHGAVQEDALARPTLTVRDFRAGFASLTEPTDVGPSPTGPKGTWFPGGHECDDNLARMGQHAPAAVEAARTKVEGLEEINRNLTARLVETSDALTVASDEIARLKRELAKGHAGEPLPPMTGEYSRQGDLAVRGILGKLATGRKGRGD